MMLSRSFWMKVVATIGAAVGFVFVYEANIPDSWSNRGAIANGSALPKPGARLHFTATAYCKGETTASGVSVRTGIAAADPTLLPVGTVVRIDTPDSKMNGIWTVMDTGPAVQGRTIDLYLWSCHEALRFGRVPIQLEVLRLGWHPQNSQPGRAQSLFRQREQQRSAPPSEPVLPAPQATGMKN
jgi:3D (Asp-Asp-Asp) domain-containing protein